MPKRASSAWAMALAKGSPQRGWFRRDRSRDRNRDRSTPSAPLLVDGGIDLLGGTPRIGRQCVVFEPVENSPGAARVGFCLGCGSGRHQPRHRFTTVGDNHVFARLGGLYELQKAVLGFQPVCGLDRRVTAFPFEFRDHISLSHRQLLGGGGPPHVHQCSDQSPIEINTRIL